MTLLRELVDASERVGSTSSRRTKVAEIVTLLRALQPDEIDIGVAYLAGELRQRRTGIGYSLIQSAQTAPACSSSVELHTVDRTVQAVTDASGRGSVGQRTRLLTELFAACTEREQSFVARLLLGELRQGALEGLMIDAVATAAQLPVADVRRAAMIAGGIGAVARPALMHGAAGLQAFSIKLFQPLAPMLAQPADDVADALTRVAPASIEWKLDGARVQVHKSGTEVRIYSRTGNDVTAAAAEIVNAVRVLAADTLILDGEAIALRSDGTPYPFQDTMRRFGRVLDIDRMRAAMPLSVFFFDCLHLNGEDLVALTGAARFDALSAALPRSMVMPRIEASDLATAQQFYDDAVARMHEGVMIKATDAPYEPGSRSASWLKVKRAHTLDLVVIAAEWGHGRRRGWLSNLHLAARDAESGDFVMLGKTFKGMTDTMLEWQTRELLARAVTQPPWGVQVRPELVIEVTFNDLQTSTRYPAGLALRFARVKGYRPDKLPADVDTMETVRSIYAGQAAPHSDLAI